MDKEKVLSKVYYVKQKRTQDYIQESLSKIEDYINKQETFSYHSIMRFIESQKSNKLGGNYGYINKALEFLKNELKEEYKSQKKENE